jgi:hypothetical protein
MSDALPRAVQLKVSLIGLKPAVWRRLLLPEGAHLGDLHEALQTALGWDGPPQHEFRIGGLCYGDPQPAAADDDRPAVFDERAIRLRDFFPHDAPPLLYACGTAETWLHLIELERLVTLKPMQKCPACLAGGGAVPRTLENALEHGLRQLLLERAHGQTHVDPGEFDLAAVDHALRQPTDTRLRIAS